MRQAVLFIAMSLDGYLADQNGGVGWLEGEDPDAETPDTYTAFIREADTVLMGRRTYDQVVTELSPGKWPYCGLTTYVVTHRDAPPAEGVVFTQASPACSGR